CDKVAMWEVTFPIIRHCRDGR
ncbi:Protein of unknown function, partial [Gryllus bimaculatus]